jgi:hypothetical protein
MTDEVTPGPAEDGRQRSIRLGVILVLAFALLAAGLRIVDYGFVPPDDALRHAASVVADRPYTDVILYDDDMAAVDTTPGWHALLGALNEFGGLDRFALVSFSVFFLFSVFTLSPLFLLRRPEAWAAVLLLAIVVNPGYPVRLALGRPFILSSAAVLYFVLAWDRLVEDPRSRSGLLLCFAAAAVTAWLHSSWFLLYAVPLAALLTGKSRATAALFASVTAGILVGAVLTLQPWTHLTYNVLHVAHTVGAVPPAYRVSELQPFIGDWGYVTFAVVALLAGATLTELRGFTLRHAGVMTVATAWVLGFSANRFWSDLGLAALLATLALCMDRILVARQRWDAAERALLVVGLAAALYLSISANHGGRWEGSPLPPMASLEYAPGGPDAWLPGEGGVVYSPDQRVFYAMYMLWPNGGWNYALGPERAVMRQQDLDVMLDFLERGSWDALRPWVEGLRPEDRLIVNSTGRAPPIFEGTESQPLAGGLIILRRAAPATGG